MTKYPNSGLRFMLEICCLGKGELSDLWGLKDIFQVMTSCTKKVILEAYLEPSQTSMMRYSEHCKISKVDVFGKIVNS